MKRTLVALVALVAVLATAVVGCSGGKGAGPRAAQLEVSGRAEVAPPGGQYRPLGSGGTVRAGDRVRLDEGTAVLRLGDAQVELRSGSEVELRLPPGSGSPRPALLAGKALVTARGAPVQMTTPDADVSVSGGSTRVEHDRGSLIGVYEGTVSVSSAGRSLPVAALHQVSVPAPGQIGAPAPLKYAESDPWDQRILGDAIDLGNQLVARSNGFTAQLAPGEGHSAGFYRRILPALEKEPAFGDSSLNASRPPGENLVGLAITVQGTRGAFADRLRSVFAFRDEGAEWGMVALDQGVSRAPVLARVDEAIGKGPPSAAEQPAPRPTAPPTTRRRASSRSTSPPTAVAPPAPTSGRAPPPSSTGGAQTGIPLVDNTVNSLVDLLSGLLGGLGRR